VDLQLRSAAKRRLSNDINTEQMQRPQISGLEKNPIRCRAQHTDRCADLAALIVGTRLALILY